MKPLFRKRVFTLSSFFMLLAKAAVRLPTLLRALRRPTTSAALREQVMLAVTSVNDCRYCAWAHTHLALKEGVDLRDLQALLDQRGGQQDDATAVAILFAQHFADRQTKASAVSVERLEAHFSPAQRDELLAYLYAIYFANLSGNSFDSLIARVQGHRVEDSHFAAALLSSLLSWPILIAIRIAAHNDRRVSLGSLD